MDLMEAASVMFNPEDSEEVQETKAGSIRRGDEREEEDGERKECEARSKSTLSCWKRLKDCTTS